jgi:hypothetical protein
MLSEEPAAVKELKDAVEDIKSEIEGVVPRKK